MQKKNYAIIAIVVLDQILKFLVINKNIVIIPDLLSITYVQNTGGAFGIGTLNIIIPISIFLLITIFLYIIKQKEKIIHFLPWGFIISGAIGNLIDRLCRGYVIDFISIYKFPVFNLSDICLTLGMFSLLIKFLKKEDLY